MIKKFVSALLISAMPVVFCSSLQCFAKESSNKKIESGINLQIENDTKSEKEVEVTQEKSGILSSAWNYIKKNKWWIIAPAVVGATQAVVLASDRYLGQPSRAALKTLNLSNEATGKYVKIMQDICKDPVKRGRFEDFSNVMAKIPGGNDYILTLYPAYDAFRDKPDKYIKSVGKAALAGGALGADLLGPLGGAVGGLVGGAATLVALGFMDVAAFFDFTGLFK